MKKYKLREGSIGWWTKEYVLPSLAFGASLLIIIFPLFILGL